MSPARRAATLEVRIDVAVRELLDPANRGSASAFPRAGDPVHQPGLYAWFVDQVGAAQLSAALQLPVAPGLIYAGQAGAGASTATLRSRLRGNHLGGTITGSTFRLTLASALAGTLHLVDAGGRALEGDGEARLSAWMREHLSLAVTGESDRAAVMTLEEAALARLDPPLNLQGMHSTPLRTRISTLRSGRAKRRTVP